MQYLSGESTKIPKGLGADINNFVIEDDLLLLKTKTVYHKTYKRVCLPPKFRSKAFVISHMAPAAGHGGQTVTIE